MLADLVETAGYIRSYAPASSGDLRRFRAEGISGDVEISSLRRE